MNKVIFYYQTFKDKNDQYIFLDSVLYPNTPLTHIHISSIHFGINSDNTPYIHLNNRTPDNIYFDPIWKNIQKAHTKGITIIAMIGGAGGGYSSLFSDFNKYYSLLYSFLLDRPYIQGVDLDIEESCSLDNVKMLIQRLIQDFGKEYIITTAPVQSSLTQDIPGMSGFCYKELLNSDEGKYISYINCQAYQTYTLEILDEIVKNGYPVDKIVMGMLSGQNYKEELKKMVEKYKHTFGGVFIWEYFNTIPTPLDWLKTIQNIAISY